MNIADYLFDRRAANIEADWLADILDRLVWLMDDNGTEIREAMERWLLSNDPDRIAVVLASEESIPFKDRETMKSEFDRICDFHPQFKERCIEIMAARDRQRQKLNQNQSR